MRTQTSLYLNENGFGVVLGLRQSVDGGHRDLKARLQSHLDGDPLLLLGYDERREVFGV